ncbi:MAG: zinc-dependent metalloprotease [Myxococcota bacterium]|nr:zinc-dependent metalloprotease [Myxococcota bacterium]
MGPRNGSSRLTVAPRLVACAVLLFGAGCAEELGDIDRTQANYLAKRDLAGAWYYLQTVVGVPPTSAFTFMGETSVTEKIRWRIQEKYLVGYRAYPKVPGAERPSTLPADFYGEEYTENPIVAYRIESHFDRMREYNATTGEETNVLVENDTDRPWFEREYVRVDWSENLVTNFDFITVDYLDLEEGSALVKNLEYFVPEEQGGEDALHTERDDAGQLTYLDYVGKMFVQPDEWGCYFTWMGWSAEDCTAGEIKVRHSFARAPEEPDYEPFQYDDNLMSKFGYFRSERVTYDEQRGQTDSGRRYMINRHNIWRATYRRDAATGEYLRDPQGRRIPIPLQERQTRTVPYYLSQDFPGDPLLVRDAFETMAQWDLAARQGVAAVQGKHVAEVGTIFTLCHNPVAAADDAACGQPGKVVRFGDLRYSVLHWVDADQLEGPLGYGPAATDPVTGEILSGKAHLYGAALNTYSSYVVDVIRFLNDDLPTDDLIEGTHFRQELLDRLTGTIDPEQLHPALARARLAAPGQAATARPADRPRAGQGKVTRRPSPAKPPAGDLRRQRLARKAERQARGFTPYSRQADEQRYQQLLEAGLGDRLLNEEVRALLAGEVGSSPDRLTSDQLARQDPASRLNPFWIKRQRELFKKAVARNVEFPDFLETSALGIARQYEGRTDYDTIWREIRALQFKAAAIHEVGHTLGLRHNFQASYDSLNYFDDYWQLRQENLPTTQPSCCPACAIASCGEDEYCDCQTGACHRTGGARCRDVTCEPGWICDADQGACVEYPQGALTYQDLYGMSYLTENQRAGRMRDFQYSSIMDYGYSFHSDLQGLGKYDYAAIAFGYGAGYDEVPASDRRCQAADVFPGPAGLSCLVQRPGPIEVFARPRGELGRAGELLSGTETHFGHTVRYDDSNIPNVNLLERCHYTSVARSFPELADLSTRRWMRYDDYLAATAAGTGRSAAERAAEPVRVPYAFCSDEWTEQMLSCQYFDQGADPFEMTMTQVNHWRAYYYFDNFRRDRFGWDPWMVLERTYWNNFLPLSDYHQFWWFAEDEYDPLFDLYYELSAYTAFNLLAEVIATPSYGTYCQGKDGSLFPRSDDPSRRDQAEYVLHAYCVPDEPDVEVVQGDGRRRFSRFAFDSGYYAYDRPLEAGHWWTTTAAIWALTDPDASVIGVDADSGTYAITFYDLFPEEFGNLAAGVVAEQYPLFGPSYLLGGDKDANGLTDGQLLYRPAAPLPVWDEAQGGWVEVNPETGQEVPPRAGAAPSRALCETCSDSEQCLGHTGAMGGTFCQPLQEEDTTFYCLQDCSEYLESCDEDGQCDEDLNPCRADEYCDDYANCVPDDLTCVPSPCSLQTPLGTCATGSSCQGGRCEPLPLMLRTDPTLMLVDDIFFWGLYMLTSGYELRFNDSFKVFRLGTDEEETPDGVDFTRITFTDPIGGQQYGALQPRCADEDAASAGGPAGLCSPCASSEECAGYTGEYGGTYCQPLQEDDEAAYCLQDCTEYLESCDAQGNGCDESLNPCAKREHCDDYGNCVPDDFTCEPVPCSPSDPLGYCLAGHTCVDGECREVFVPNARCRNLALADSPAVVMVKKGQELSAAYLEALDTYYQYDGRDPALDEELFWDYLGKKWRFDGFMVNLNILRSYFTYFGGLF